jgi:preprotein translocase subunit SecG
MLESLVVVFHLLTAIGIVVLVLLQQGKGAEAGASFGAGASGTVFGSQGSTTFLSRFTAILAAAFFATSLGLGFYAKQQAGAMSSEGLPSPAALEVPQQQPAVSDVPVLESEAKAAGDAADVPVVPAK